MDILVFNNLVFVDKIVLESRREFRSVLEFKIRLFKAYYGMDLARADVHQY